MRSYCSKGCEWSNDLLHLPSYQQRLGPRDLCNVMMVWNKKINFYLSFSWSRCCADPMRAKNEVHMVNFSVDSPVSNFVRICWAFSKWNMYEWQVCSLCWGEFSTEVHRSWSLTNFSVLVIYFDALMARWADCSQLWFPVMWEMLPIMSVSMHLTCLQPCDLEALYVVQWDEMAHC
jgi:hypothetical protein